MQDFDINALGQAIDTTFTRSSTPNASSYSVKAKLLNNILQITFGGIVKFGTHQEMILVKREYAQLADQLIKDSLDSIKKTYAELSDDTLRVKEESSDDSCEIINMNFYNPIRTAMYRKVINFEIL